MKSTSHHTSTSWNAAGKLSALLLVSAAALSTTTVARADDSETAALREQIETLTKKVDKLEKRQVMTDADEAKAAPVTPKTTVDSKGLNIALPDKSYAVKIGLLLQTDGRFYAETSTAVKDTFFMRRVRLPVTGTIGKYFKFDLTPEFAQADNTTAGLNSQLFDAWVEARLSPLFGLKFGKFRTPVVLSGPDNRHFIEASWPNYLAPNRDIGVDASGSVAEGFFTYRLGLYNGAPNNVWNQTTDIDDHVTLEGRLGLDPFKSSDNFLSGLSFSVGASYGSEYAQAASAIRTAGQQNFVTIGTATGDHLRVAPAVAWYYGAFSVVGEFVIDDYVHVGASAKRVTNYGWSVAGGWVITGEKSTASGVSPAAPFNLSSGTFGAFELVARVGGLDVDETLHNANTPGSAFSYGVGLNWYLTDNILFRLGIERTHFGGVKPNAGATSVIKDDELYVFSRFQLKF
jgi:phosphate-selective porin OprO/OprP